MPSLYSMLRSRFGPSLPQSVRHARIEEKLRLERPRWQPPAIPALCSSRLNDTSVAIVGGGLAGLSAAKTLRRSNAAVTIFEATELWGGRARSNETFAEGRIVEEGAELIGSIHPMWRALAREYGLAWISRMDEDFYAQSGLELRVRHKNRFLSEEELKALTMSMERRVLKPISRQAARVINVNKQPWEQSWLRIYDGKSVAKALTELGVKKEELLWEAMEMLLVNNNVASLDELNYLGLLCLVRGGQFNGRETVPMGYWEELEIFRAADGCQALANKMAGEVDKDHKHLNTKVTDIDFGKRVTVTWSRVDKDGSLLGTKSSDDFDYVIFAIPPSVWADVTITPKHPKDADQVGVMGMGPAVKFFSRVKERFWIKDGLAPNGGSSDIGQVWEGTDNQTRVRTQPIVLSVFAGGRVPTEPQFRKGLRDLYPNYANNLERTLLVDWSSPIQHRFIQTGYSSPRMDQIFSIGRKLNEPFQKRMFFAGEHTHMYYFGYMEGALRSGARAARQVIHDICSSSAPAPARRTPKARVA